MIAQTNIQLYRQLIDAGWHESDLRKVRNAYQLAQELVGNSFRPNGKPFVCHLVGTASVLAHWNQRPAMVLTGLLHAAYLYGDFGDGERRDSPRRRSYVQSIVGGEAEALLQQFMQSRGINLQELTDCDLLVLSLADLLEELVDAGPAFAVGKPVAEIDSKNQQQQRFRDIIAIANSAIGISAGQMFDQAFSELQSVAVPDCLTSNQRASRPVPQGVAALRRNKIGRRIAKLQAKIAAKRAA